MERESQSQREQYGPTRINPPHMQPSVSVLMPTFKQAQYIRRSLESLYAQHFTDWELIIVDDGSPDNTSQLLQPYLADSRICYHRLAKNQGLGAALNIATKLARGRYLAYLPSDDVYYPDHLARLVACLEQSPDTYLAYGGVRWGDMVHAPTLQGAEVVGHELEALERVPERLKDAPLPNSNILALVQVMHRRDWEPELRWPARAEIVSDRLMPDFWRALLKRGARFTYTDEVSCEWVIHAEQRQRNIAAYTGGLSRYRSFYGIGRGEYLNWQPSRGWPVNEYERYGRFGVERDLPAIDGLKILIVGELGFNPERIVAFEEGGHKLYGLWIPEPETWDATGPFPFGNMEDIPYDRNWPKKVREIRPDIIYALLNWQSIKLVRELLDAELGIPLVYHFKEGPQTCMDSGLWPDLLRILSECDGRIFISEENYTWFQLATDHQFAAETVFILDGDLPKRDWMSDAWSPRLSEQDGMIHTVCTGRPIGITPIEQLFRADIHIHLYGVSFHQGFPGWVREGLEVGVLHLHPTVDPQDWVRELSQYDAGWFHIFSSFNQGDLRRARWDDLNIPARVGTYAAAGLPWIMKDNRDSRVAIQSLAEQDNTGIFFNDFGELAEQLRDRCKIKQLSENMRAARTRYAFDSHVGDLIAFFRSIIERYPQNQK